MCRVSVHYMWTKLEKILCSSKILAPEISVGLHLRSVFLLCKLPLINRNYFCDFKQMYYFSCDEMKDD